MQTVTINGEVRTELGKASGKNLRKSGKIPAIIYGEEGNTHFSTTHKEVKNLVFTPDFKLAEINIDGNKTKTILKDIQFHPVSDEILHIDFLQLADGREVKIDLPVRFEGVSPGVKDGGIFIQALRKIQVKTTPEHITDHLVVNISELRLGSAIRVGHLEVVDGVEVLTSPSIPIASVAVPRALKTLEEEEAEAAEAAEAEAALLAAEEGGEEAPAAEGSE